MINEPPLLEEYLKAHYCTLSPARKENSTSSVNANRFRRTLRSSSREYSTQLLPSLTSSFIRVTVEKALHTITRCASPSGLDSPKQPLRRSIEVLPPDLIEQTLGHLTADDLCSVASCSRYLKERIPAAAVLSAQKVGFQLSAAGPRITRRLHTCEMQAWLAGRVMVQLGSSNRRTRETAVLRCASLPIQCVAHHDVELLQHSASPDASVRLRALRTLSHFGMEQKERLLRRNPEAVAVVLPRLEDEDALVRRAALNVLGGWLLMSVWPTEAVDEVDEISQAISRRIEDDNNECVRAASERVLLTHREHVPMCT